MLKTHTALPTSSTCGQSLFHCGHMSNDTISNHVYALVWSVTYTCNLKWILSHYQRKSCFLKKPLWCQSCLLLHGLVWRKNLCGCWKLSLTLSLFWNHFPPSVDSLGPGLPHRTAPACSPLLCPINQRKLSVISPLEAGVNLSRGVISLQGIYIFGVSIIIE